MIPTSDSLEAWIEHAESALHALAHELRRLPFRESTRPLHVRALELKHEIALWRDNRPAVAERTRALDEIEALAQKAKDDR